MISKTNYLFLKKKKNKNWKIKQNIYNKIMRKLSQAGEKQNN